MPVSAASTIARGESSIATPRSGPVCTVSEKVLPAPDSLRTVSASLKHGFCDACFSDQYPVAVEDGAASPQLTLFRSVEDDEA